MTDYEKIETGLIELGWTPESGKGDHVKFSKAGFRRPITISRRVSGRSYQNCVANIRQVEPDFLRSQSKVTKSKSEIAAAEIHEGVLSMTQEQKDAARKYIFVYKDAEVRYTGPEGKDYDKLSDPNSLMSHKYIVKELRTESGKPYITSGNDKAVIWDGTEGSEMEIAVCELDAWELKGCPSCGKKYPSNIFGTDSDKCPDCVRKSSELMNSIRGIKPDIQDGETALKNFNILCEDIMSELKDYDNVPLSDLPVSVQQRLFDEIKRNADKIKDSGTGGVISKAVQNLASIVESPKKVSMYEAWMGLLRSLFPQYCEWMNNGSEENGTPKMTKEKLKKIFFGTSYSTGTVAGLPMLSISVTDESVLDLMVFSLNKIWTFFGIHFSKDSAMVFRMVCLKSGFDEYFPVCGRYTKEAAVKLCESLSDSDMAVHCHYAKEILNFPDTEELQKKADALIEPYRNNGGNEYNITTSVVPSFSLNFVALYVRYNVIGPEGELVDRIRNDGAQISDSVRENLDYDDLNIEVIVNNRLQDWNLHGNEEETPVNPYSLKPGERLMLRPIRKEEEIKLMIPRDLLDSLDETAKDSNMSRQEFLLDIIEDYLYNSGVEFEVNGLEEDEDEDETEYITNNKNIGIMEEIATIDSLNTANPSSDNAQLKDVTTRELLRELKARGVEFGDITIPVVTRMSVDINEL